MAARFHCSVFQLPPHKLEADVLVDQPQQVGLRNMIFQAEVIEQRFGAVVLPHHDQQASDDENPTEHGQMLSSSTLLLNLILRIDVTFSTPTPDIRSCSFHLDKKNQQQENPVVVWGVFLYFPLVGA